MNFYTQVHPTRETELRWRVQNYKKGDIIGIYNDAERAIVEDEFKKMKGIKEEWNEYESTNN